jgi:hypothetical protein
MTLCAPRTARSPVADWHWEPFRDELLDGFPGEARAGTERPANEIAVREAMVFPEGAAYTALDDDRVSICEVHGRTG